MCLPHVPVGITGIHLLSLLPDIISLSKATTIDVIKFNEANTFLLAALASMRHKTK